MGMLDDIIATVREGARGVAEFGNAVARAAAPDATRLKVASKEVLRSSARVAGKALTATAKALARAGGKEGDDR